MERKESHEFFLIRYSISYLEAMTDVSYIATIHKSILFKVTRII